MKFVVDKKVKDVSVEVFFERKVKKFSKSGHITLPKEYVGRDVLVAVLKKKVVSIQEVKSKF